MAATLPKTDSLGQTYYQTGFQLFLSCRLVAYNAGLTWTGDVPGSPTFQTNPVGSATVSAGAISVTHSAVHADEELLIFASPPRSAGVSYNSDYRYMGKISPKTAGSYVFTTPYLAAFGLPADDQKVFVRCVQVLAASGLANTPEEFTCIWEN